MTRHPRLHLIVTRRRVACGARTGRATSDIRRVTCDACLHTEHAADAEFIQLNRPRVGERREP